MGDKCEFIASFPDIQSAIKVGGDGMRIQLDVPESEMGNALGIMAWRRKALKITVEVSQSLTDKENGEAEIDERTAGNPLGVAGG
jgi:hypothetical protein